MVVFVHGFTGHKNEHQFFNAARFLKRKEFQLLDLTFIVGKMMQENLMIALFPHGQDLDTLIKYFRNKGVKKISVVGHSFGGPSVLLSKRKILILPFFGIHREIEMWL